MKGCGSCSTFTRYMSLFSDNGFTGLTEAMPLLVFEMSSNTGMVEVPVTAHSSHQNPMLLSKYPRRSKCLVVSHEMNGSQLCVVRRLVTHQLAGISGVLAD